MGGISIWQLLILLVIVVLLFGTKKLKNIGADAGAAVKGFKNAMGEGEKDAADDKSGKPANESKPQLSESGEVIEGEVTKKEQEKS